MSNSCDADYFLDITSDVCPITFVKTKLKLEKMQVGETLSVRLKGEEPRRNVPESVQELGHLILKLEPEVIAEGVSVFHLLIRKKG